MKLKAYQKKRNFNKTVEPKGKISKTSLKNLFVIQKHAASHLHYDFRLELNGVLLSWAIPKGPSLNPAIKRLAIHVEDHPIEYGSFEGIIPKGQYGGGAVMLWDKGEWYCEEGNPEEAYKKGHLTVELRAKKLNGKWKLIRMHNDDKTWLLIKVKDHYAKSGKASEITLEQPDSVVSHKTIDELADSDSAHFFLHSKTPQKFPQIIYPELATLVDAPPVGKNWLHEIKFDGYRLLIFKNKNKTVIYTRHHQDWTNQFKIIQKEVNRVFKKNVILDGEVVVFDKNQHSNFQLLQNSIKENNNNFYYYVFDLLYYDHFNLMDEPLLKRKKILEELFSTIKSDTLLYSDHVIGDGKKILKKMCQLGLEGIVSKNSESVYSQKRDKNWLKIKCIKRQEFVIAGFSKSVNRKYFRSLVLGIYNEKGQFIYCGNVGTGFTQVSSKMIYDKLNKLIIKKMPFQSSPSGPSAIIWVKPTLVAEIEFIEWTASGLLRHPSFKGLRSDKSAKKIIKETEIPIEKIVKPDRDIRMKLTHPDKILYPEDKITKQDIADYYETVQDWILPYIINRPLTLVRCPDDYLHCFYQKHIKHTLPTGVHEITIKEKEGKGDYLYIDGYEGLMAFPQLGILELHPWGCHINQIEKPDIVIFDLDPAPKVPWKKVVKAAFDIKNILDDLTLKSYVKTTGGKGLHVVIPIKPEYGWEDVSQFAHTLVDYMVKNNSQSYIGKMSKSARQHKIFIDYLRNKRGATAVAPYSLRAKKHAPVSTPLEWDELTHDRRDSHFTIRTVMKRLQQLKKDPWKDFLKIKQSLNLDKLKNQ